LAHGAIVGLLLGKRVHALTRPDHNAAKLKELFEMLGIAALCSDAVLMNKVDGFPFESVAEKIQMCRSAFPASIKRIVAALDPSGDLT
jgi:hypothetical protein